MLNRLWIWTGRVPKAEEPAVSDLVKGLMRVDERSRVAVMVLALGPRLRERLDLAKCLRLAAVGDLAPEAAERLGGRWPVWPASAGTAPAGRPGWSRRCGGCPGRWS